MECYAPGDEPFSWSVDSSEPSKQWWEHLERAILQVVLPAAARKFLKVLKGKAGLLAAAVLEAGIAVYFP